MVSYISHKYTYTADKSYWSTKNKHGIIIINVIKSTWLQAVKKTPTTMEIEQSSKDIKQKRWSFYIFQKTNKRKQGFSKTPFCKKVIYIAMNENNKEAVCYIEVHAGRITQNISAGKKNPTYS